MAYVDNLVIVTTYIKNQQKGSIDDKLDQQIFKYLAPLMNYAAQKGNTTLTFAISDISNYLSFASPDLHIQTTDYGETLKHLEHVIDQLNDKSNHNLKLTHFSGLWYVIEWPDDSEF